MIDISKQLKNILRNKKLVLVVGVVIFLCISIILLLIIFGVDQKIIKTSLKGTVNTVSGEPVAGAHITLQGKDVETNKDGFFYIPNLRYGTYELTVEKNSFSPYKTTTKLNRFQNKLDVTLKYEEFGELRLEFQTKDFTDNIPEVTINSTPFILSKVEEGYLLNTGRLLVGSYLLELFSSDYKEINERITIVPGLLEKAIVLESTADIVTEIQDYVNTQSIIPDKVIVSSGESNREVSKEELIDNRLELKDLPVRGNITIKINKAGYLTKVLTINLKQGLNSLGTTKLVPDKKYLIPEENSIWSTYIDGSSAKQVFEGYSSCEFLYTKAQNVHLIKCGDTILAFIEKEDNFQLLGEYNWSFKPEDYLVNEKKLLVIANNLQEIAMISESNNFETIYSHKKLILSAVVDDSGEIYFSDDEALYKLNRNNSSAELLLKGRYFLEDISSDSTSIIALSRKYSFDNNIWLINIKTNTSKKINFLPGSFSDVQFLDNNNFLYLDEGNLFLKDINSLQQGELLKNIKNYWVGLEHTVFLGTKEQSGEIVFDTLQDRAEKSIVLTK